MDALDILALVPQEQPSVGFEAVSRPLARSRPSARRGRKRTFADVLALAPAAPSRQLVHRGRLFSFYKQNCVSRLRIPAINH